MAKQAQKEAPKPKSLKDQKKELEARLFGEKNSSKKKEIMGMIKKLDISIKLETEKRAEKDNAKKPQYVRQLIPVGVDPKTVQCVNYANKICDKGDDCPFAHEIVKKEASKEIAVEDDKPKSICKFLIDAINKGEHGKNWECPMPNCRDIHKLTELTENSEVEVTLEEYIELQRQSLGDNSGTPVTEETFKTWREKKDREEELHAKRVALLSGVRGADLFMSKPEMFEDDEEADENVEYSAREYTDSDDEDATLIECS